MHVKGPLLVNGSGTCEHDLQLASAKPRVNGTKAHSSVLKPVILCLSTYHDIPRQAIPYIMRYPPGHTIYQAMAARPYHISCRTHQAIPYSILCPRSHTIYHVMPARPYHILCQAPCIACQAITIHHAMPAKPYHIPSDARKAILYHAMPSEPHHIPCQAHQAIP